MVGLKRSDCFINNYLVAVMTENWQERDNHQVSYRSVHFK